MTPSKKNEVRVFVSSPIHEMKIHREEVARAFDALNRYKYSGVFFDYFMYEIHSHGPRLPKTTYAEHIFEQAGTDWDIFLVFFANHVGDDTCGEFKIFRDIVLADVNPECALWWHQLDYQGKEKERVRQFKDELKKIWDELPSLFNLSKVKKTTIYDLVFLNGISYFLDRRRTDS